MPRSAKPVARAGPAASGAIGRICKLAFVDRKASAADAFRQPRSETLELRDPYTSGHAQRVTDYALLLADELKLPSADRQTLQIASPLHDIGKIGLSDAILRKSDSLNAEERKQMNTFEQQLAGGLYKVWPEKPLEPGEYALVEFADTQDQQDIELLVWDFAIPGATK